MSAHPYDVVIVAPLGPNPAPLAELIWALRRQRGLMAAEVHVVVDAGGHLYLHEELLAPGGPLDELAELFGPELVDRARVHERLVTLPGGAPLEDDDDPIHAELYNAAVWETARDAIASAGSRRVVFGLLAGRRRTMTAMATASFQLLARPGDLCIDVRVDERRAEGGSGFFFPEQGEQLIESRQGAFLARDVGVLLVDVHLPRLRGLLSDRDLESYESALVAGQAAVDAAQLPSLFVDLVEGVARVNESALPLSPAQLLWYGALAVARRRGEGWLVSDDFELLREVALACAHREWMGALKSEPIRALMGRAQGYDEDDLIVDLKRLRTETRSRVRDWCREHARIHTALLVPRYRARGDGKGGRVHAQRLELDPAAVEVRGLEGT